jgi:CHASE2 domain-containing sensor protein
MIVAALCSSDFLAFPASPWCLVGAAAAIVLIWPACLLGYLFLVRKKSPNSDKRPPRPARRPSPQLVRDLCVVAGVLLLLWGAWAAWPPLGPILAGLVTLGFGLLWQFSDDVRRAQEEWRRRRNL